MAYRLRPRETVVAGIRRICREQIKKALAELGNKSLDRPKAVHEVRKCCKRIRGALRLVRPELDDYQKENAWFRDAARALARMRDAEVMVQCYDTLMTTYDEQVDQSTFASVRRELALRQQRVSGEAHETTRRLDQCASRLRQARARVGSWRIAVREFGAVKRGWRKTYRRGRRAMAAAYARPSPENFHEWRKRVKYQRYQTRLLRRLWPPVMEAHWSEVKHLSDLLGDDHDLAILKQTIEQGSADFGGEGDVQAFLGLVDRRRIELQSEARGLGRRVYAEKPKNIVRRLQAYWHAQSDANGRRSVKRTRKGPVM